MLEPLKPPQARLPVPVRGRTCRLPLLSPLFALLASLGCTRPPETAPVRDPAPASPPPMPAQGGPDPVRLGAALVPNALASSAETAKRAGRSALGRAIFFDTSLSEPAGTSCASCHDPSRAFSGQNGSARGVPRGSRPQSLARRNSPSLLYLKYVPKFHYAPEDEATPELAPFGGLFWDGRVDSIAELVQGPLLNPDEMNNRDAASIAAKVLASPYAVDFEREFGKPEDPQRTLLDIGQAVEAFLTADEMAPFSSKFDQFLRGRGELSSVELQGMRLFKDPAKGGCVACHTFDDATRDPSKSLFSDYGYDALAVPRNTDLPRRKPDLGLCERTDRATPSDESGNCARFRTPSLRNVATRTSFMHNGAFKSLRDAVAFYATRATNPRRWYKSGVRFEDIPARYRDNVNSTSPPYNRREGEAPALDDQEIDAIVAFLQTLTDTR